MANEAKPCACDIGDRMEYGGQGQETQIGHVKAYVVKPAIKSDKAVIVINDIFGWQLPNTRYMADMISANGYIAIVPDFFLGKEPWNPSKDLQDQSGTLTRNFQEWMKDKEPTKINKEVDTVLKYLREQCGARRIGSVGFCWGGIAVHHLALEYPDIQAGVAVYGIIRDEEDRYQLKFPTLYIYGDKDEFISLDQINVLKKRLQEKCKADFQVKIYPGQTHGFVHRKREDINPADKPFIQEGRIDMIKWLKKYI